MGSVVEPSIPDAFPTDDEPRVDRCPTTKLVTESMARAEQLPMQEYDRVNRINGLVFLRLLLESGLLKLNGSATEAQARVEHVEHPSAYVAHHHLRDCETRRWWNATEGPTPDLFDCPLAGNGFLWDSRAASDVVPTLLADGYPGYMQGLGSLIVFNTAKDKTTVTHQFLYKCRGQGGEGASGAMRMPRAPSLLSPGQRCLTQGVASIWMPKKQLCIVTPGPARSIILLEVETSSPKLSPLCACAA